MELKMSNAKQGLGIVHACVTIQTSDAKKGCDKDTMEHKRQEEIRSWHVNTQALQQESTYLMAQLAAAHLDIRRRMLVIMAIVPMAALLWITEPYCEKYRPAAYTVQFIVFGMLVAAIATLMWALLQGGPACTNGKLVIRTSTVMSAAARLLGDVRKIATNNKSCEGHPCQVSLPVSLVQKQAEVWEAQHKALCTQEERDGLLEGLAQSADTKVSMHFLTLLGLMSAAGIFVSIRAPEKNLKDLDPGSMLLLHIVPAVVLLGWIIVFKAVKTECKQLSDESKKLSKKVAEASTAKGCAYELV